MRRILVTILVLLTAATAWANVKRVTSLIPRVFINDTRGSDTVAIQIENDIPEDIQQLRVRACFDEADQDCVYVYFDGPFPKHATTWSRDLHFSRIPESLKLIVTNP